MDKLLAVFDTDILYATRLMEYLKEADWECFEILLFTRQESLFDFLKYQKIDILLYGGELLPEELPKNKIKYIFRLCKDRRLTKDKEEIIFKYQAASKIASDIISRYTRLEDKANKKVYDDMRFISIFAPVPGAEKISYSWSLAKILSNTRKVLFVSFEQLPTVFMTNKENTGQTMSELLYYLKENNSNHIINFRPYINYSEKLSYLSEPSHGFDLLSINREDISKLMDKIKEDKDYELVIFYLGIYTEASMFVLSHSHEVCIVSCDLPYEELVIIEWERQMKLAGTEVKQLNHHRIKLPTVEQAIGQDLLPEHIQSLLKPMAEEVAAKIL